MEMPADVEQRDPPSTESKLDGTVLG